MKCVFSSSFSGHVQGFVHLKVQSIGIHERNSSFDSTSQWPIAPRSHILPASPKNKLPFPFLGKRKSLFAFVRCRKSLTISFEADELIGTSFYYYSIHSEWVDSRSHRISVEIVDNMVLTLC